MRNHIKNRKIMAGKEGPQAPVPQGGPDPQNPQNPPAGQNPQIPPPNQNPQNHLAHSKSHFAKCSSSTGNTTYVTTIKLVPFQALNIQVNQMKMHKHTYLGQMTGWRHAQIPRPQLRYIDFA